MEYLYINDRIVHQSEAVLSVFDLGLLRGYGVFDFFKVHDGVPVFAEDHIARFIRSASLLNLKPLPTPATIRQLVGNLIEKNNIVDGTFRFILTAGISSNGITIDGTPTFIIIPATLSFKIYHDIGQMKPLRLMTIDYVRETPEIKSLNYLVPMMHWPAVIQGGFDDVLYVSYNIVSETSRANIFFVTPENVLVTPVKNVLFGVTRKYVIEVARAKGITVEERAITLDEALQCKEAFLSSSTKQVMPVSHIDQHVMHGGTPGNTTKLLFDSFYDFEMKHIAIQKLALHD